VIDSEKAFLKDNKPITKTAKRISTKKIIPKVEYIPE
jgi:hypothetical protein